MVDEQVTIAIMHNGIAAGSNNRAVATEKNRSTTLKHTNTAFISIGTSDGARTSDDDVVGTIDATTAHIERGKQVVIAAMRVDVSTFNAFACIQAHREMVERLIGGQLFAS